MCPTNAQIRYTIVNTAIVNTNFDWQSVKSKYSIEELDKMRNWIDNQKVLLSDEIDVTTTDDVNPDDLNTFQRFTFNIIRRG